ncbi:MAG TPA: hypothetical protein VFL85_00210 [Candidatus Saccharimonadales bacterium]|nr:hypothetical protein [Candidatus Saccharimonadales bacterium]
MGKILDINPHIEHQRIKNERETAKRERKELSVKLAALGVAASLLGLAATHEQGGMDADAKVTLQRLEGSGHVEKTFVVEGGQPYFTQPNVRLHNSEQFDATLAGKLPEDTGLKINKPVTVTGTDGREYVITRNPASYDTASGPSPTSLPDLAKASVAIPVSEGTMEYRPDTADNFLDDATLRAGVDQASKHVAAVE